VTDYKKLVEEYIHSSSHLSKKHVHPRLAKLFEVGGMSAVFDRAEGQYLWDMQGNRYLDFLGGGGVFMLGRNHPTVRNALKDILELDMPNLSIVNASVLGGLLAQQLLEVADMPHFSKVFFANSGTESTDMAIRFARFVTRRRRFLYLEGGFHGRTFAAISMCGFPALRDGMEPMLPVCTPIKPNDLEQLRRELRSGDVAGLILEPVQGMTLNVLDYGYLREAEILCERYGTVLIADEVQTGLGRSGAWFASGAAGIRPGLMTCSKILSGGQVPVAALMMSEQIYEALFTKFQAGPIYFSTFAENNLAMAAGLATVEALKEIDAPTRAMYLGELLRKGIEKLAERYDVIERVSGRGLMLGVFFRESSNLGMKLQQKLLTMGDASAFAASVNVDMFRKQRVLVQIPGPGLNAIKILPPVVCTEEDVETFLSALEDTLAGFYADSTGAVKSISRGFVNDTIKTLKSAIPAGILPTFGKSAAATAEADEKKKSLELDYEKPVAPGIVEYPHYNGPVTDRADVVVVGSGPGGAFVAQRLAERGKSVILVEAGPVVKSGEFSRDLGEALSKYYWEGGLRAGRGNVMSPSLQGRVLGGTSVFNSAICLRFPDWQGRRWNEEFGIDTMMPENFDSYQEDAERIMGLEETHDAIFGRRNALFRDGGNAMGFDPTPIMRNVTGCQGSGYCLFGCNNAAKNSTDRCAIPAFVENGGRVYTSVQVETVTMYGKRAAGVEGFVVHPDTGAKSHPVRIQAKMVVMAPGAFHTPIILKRSGVDHPMLGENLRMHPGEILAGQYAEEINPWEGATQGYHITKFLQEGIKMEVAWTAPAIFAALFRGIGGQLLDQVRDYKHIATWDAWTNGDDSIGRVRALPGGRPDIQWDLGYGDIRRLQEGGAKLAEMFLATGAYRVFTPFPGEHAVLYSTDDIDRLRRAEFKASQMTTGSNHIFGTAAMGADPKRHPCNPDGSFRGVEGLYVADTGVFPTSPGVNPMQPIMAFARKMGDTIADRL
jgi:acetylornithine/succinyldiaminopimelate/putrescine aminotransferase/choline dehydrogenase-like flavoprotein